MGGSHDTISERAKYRKMWEVEEYRRNSPGFNLAQTLILPKSGSITDYGCGEGKALDVFRARGLTAQGVDIVALRPGVIEACLWEMDDEVPATDFAFCADVMEHIPHERVRDVLTGIKERTLELAIFQIASAECSCGKRYGETLHLTVRPREWWYGVLDGLWGTVISLPGDRDWRNIFICEK